MAANPQTAIAVIDQTLPRTHRCDATIGRTPTEFGFTPVTCTQTVGVATFSTTAGLRVGYCPIDGHQASVRRRFAERVADGDHERAIERAAAIAESVHDEPDEDEHPVGCDCRRCERAWETWNLQRPW